MATSYSTDTVIEDQIPECDDNLELYLKRIGRLLDIPSIINEPQEKSHVVNYYKKTKMQYRLNLSWEGYFHFGISYDGKHKREDFKEQAKIVERYIRDTDAKHVLELAYGLGANSAFLARRNPLVTFEGIDISNAPLKRFTKIPNLRFHFGDYHDLSNFEDNAYDIVFVIDALDYSTNKLQVLREVKKKLKRDGLFIVTDGYRKDRAAPLSPSEDIMMGLIEKGFAVQEFECIKDVESYMREEYSIALAKDITQCVLPSMVNLERRSRRYFAHPMFARIVFKITSYESAKNLMVAYLLPTSIRRQIFCCYLHVMKNDK
jgi:ubiquinone/menaquinone biosynthesis C-methylase UbiE